MDASQILPFIEAVQSVFGTMVNLPVTVGEPTMRSQLAIGHDVSGIIGMTGDVVGSVVLSFPRETGTGVVEAFVGERFEHTHEDFADAIGELVNMVTGSAKSKFEGRDISISCPSIIIGPDHIVQRQRDAMCISIPCSCACGEFTVEISIKEADAKGAKSSVKTAAA